MKQKDNLEYYAVNHFIAEYNSAHKRQLRFIQQCKPRMPDTLCQLGQVQVGIEVVHSYGTEEEAAMRLGNLRSEDIPTAIHRRRRCTPLDVRALNSLYKVLSDKATKTYDFSPTWLLIRNAFPLWSLTDYHKHKNEIRVPAGHPFKQIWFLCDQNSIGRHGIMRFA